MRFECSEALFIHITEQVEFCRRCREASMIDAVFMKFQISEADFLNHQSTGSWLIFFPFTLPPLFGPRAVLF